MKLTNGNNKNMNTGSEQTMNVVKDFLSSWYRELQRKVLDTTANYVRPLLSTEQLLEHEFGRNLKSIANTVEYEGEWNESHASYISVCIQSLCEDLFAQPYSYGYEIPKSFWMSEIGNLLVRAHLWTTATLQEITVENLTDKTVKISLTQRAKEHLIDSEVSLFWRKEVSKPYWAKILSYEGDVYVAEANDFAEESLQEDGKNTYSLIIEIPQTSNPIPE
jgi:hypothetical protein